MIDHVGTLNVSFGMYDVEDVDRMTICLYCRPLYLGTLAKMAVYMCVCLIPVIEQELYYRNVLFIQ